MPSPRKADSVSIRSLRPACSRLRCTAAKPMGATGPGPLAARSSRKHEFEADAYACAQTDGRDLASALLKLHEDNASTLTPDPL